MRADIIILPPFADWNTLRNNFKGKELFLPDFGEVVNLDTKYISEWSIGLDVKILFKTVRAVLRKDGAM